MLQEAISVATIEVARARRASPSKGFELSFRGLDRDICQTDFTDFPVEGK